MSLRQLSYNKLEDYGCVYCYKITTSIDINDASVKCFKYAVHVIGNSNKFKISANVTNNCHLDHSVVILANIFGLLVN